MRVRYSDTARSSSGMPRANTTPDCALTTIWRPSVRPMMAVKVVCSSAQKSALLTVSITEPVVWLWLLLSDSELLLTAPPSDAFELSPPTCVTCPELTRVRDIPPRVRFK